MDARQIKATVERQIKKLHGFEAAAEVLDDVGKSQLHRIADRNTDALPSLCLAVALDEATGHPLLIRMAAAHLGYRLVPIDGGTSVRNALAAAAGLAKDAGIVVDSIFEKAADGVFTPREISDASRELSDLEARCVVLRAALGVEGER